MTKLAHQISAQLERSAHIQMEGIRDDSSWAEAGARPAAVLVAFTERPDPGLILTQRPQTMPKHPGQVSFPGGKLEHGEDPVKAALREAEEELSIDPAKVRVIGEGRSFVTGSGFQLTPVIATVPQDISITPDPIEVDSWFEPPVRHVLNPDNHARKIGDFRGHSLPYWEIMWNQYRIWGITAGIVRNLSLRLDWRELTS